MGPGSLRDVCRIRFIAKFVNPVLFCDSRFLLPIFESLHKMADSAARITINKLNSHNYQTWSFKVELALIKDGIWDVVSENPPADPGEDWERKDQKARATIGLLVEDSQLTYIRRETTARGVWEALKNYHMKSTLSSKVFLLKKLCRKQLEEGGDMEMHLNFMTNVIDQLTEMGQELGDQLAVAMILCSLPESYGPLITALETRAEGDLTTALVKGKLIDEYLRRKENDAHSEHGAAQNEKALKVGRFGGKQERREQNKSFKDNKGCFFCHGNHFKKDCKKHAAWKAKKENKSNADTKYTQKAGKVTETDEDDNLCFKVQFPNKLCNNISEWFIDSGASSHMAGDKAFFSELKEIPKREIHLADGETIYATGIGEGILMCDVGTDNPKKVLVKDVLYVPVLKGNLLSVSKLVNKGMTVDFHDNVCDITCNGNILAQADLCSSLYRVRVSQKALQVQEKNQIKKCSSKCIHGWHKKLGHRDPSVIKQVATENLATGIQIENCVEKITCDACVRGKMTRLPFPSKASVQSKNVLDLVHSDICGPFQTVTPSGKKYVLTITDDYSRYTQVYLLARKSEAIDKVKEYVNFVKNKFGRAPRKFRSDRGGEFTGREFTEYLSSEGIKQELTAPYTPQQNGVSERKNRALLQITRCLLFESGLDKKYWGEALHTANHIQNRLPTKGSDEIPYKRWHGKCPSYEYFRAFGESVYAHNPKELTRKLDERAQKLVFVGYQEGSKAYRLLNINNDKITISRDVLFLENQTEAKQDISEEEIFGKSDEDYEERNNVHSSEDEDENVRESHQTVVPRRSSRCNKGIPPERLIETINFNKEVKIVEPKTRNQALAGPQANQWKRAMEDEMRALKESETWSLTELPQGKNLIGSKWVYKIKRDEQGNVVRYKARLVAQGYSQKFGHDYDEVFAPVVSPTTLRLLLTIAGKRNMHVRQYDVQTAFLQGDLEHEVFMRQPEGFEESGKEDLACKLQKNIYGLKQGAMEWYKKLHSILTSKGFVQSQADPCLYSRNRKEIWTYIVVHVDDIVGASISSDELDKFEVEISQDLTIKNLGKISQCLGIHYTRDDLGVFCIDQEEYIKSKLKENNWQDLKPSAFPIDPNYHSVHSDEEDLLQSNIIYRSAVGSLMYLAVNSRPDIAIATSILARKVSKPTQKDWIEVKRVFRYLKATSKFKLHLGDKSPESDAQLICYADADWGGDPENRRSNSGYLVKVFGGTVCWSSRQQKIVALPSIEAELILLTEACQEVIWIKNLMHDLNEKSETPTLIYEDNQSCIQLLKNKRVRQRTKHIDTKFNFIRDLIKEKKNSQ